MLLLTLSIAFALDADTYDASGSAPDAQGGLQLAIPVVGAPNAWYAGTQLVYAYRPVVAEYSDGSREAIVGGSFGMHLLGGYTIQGKARLDLDIPFYPYVGAKGADWNGVSFGDLRLGATVPVWGNKDFSFGLMPEITLPTGELEAYNGAGSVTARLRAAGQYRFAERYTANANLGITLGKAQELGDLTFGSNLYVGLGLGAQLNEDWGVGGELDGTVGLSGGLGPYNQNPFELHGYGSYTGLDNFVITAGLGTGIVSGVGAPALRMIAGIAWRDAGYVDTDADGLEDQFDTCPTEAEDKDGFNDTDGCPDPDNDGDLVLDIKDSCPNAKEDIDGFKDEDGCPELDNDGDALTDTEDACPNDPGPLATVGCPDRDSDGLADARDVCPDLPGPIELKGCPDRDHDQITDDRDKCPDEPKDPREDPARSDGCPKRVIVSGSHIEILDVIYFDTGKATIKDVSLSLLDEIAKTIQENPDLLLIEVSGHTDNQGKPATNLALSQARAEAVVRYLMSKGVDPARLVAKGYGQEQPIDTNNTADGRAKNRRVAFTILRNASTP